MVVPPSEYSARQGLRSLLSNPLGMLKMRKLLSTSTRTLLEEYFSTPEIFDFYDKLCSAYCYCTAAETPAVLAATMFLDNHIGGVYYPAGGAQMLPNKIEKAFERYGGQTLYRHLVDEILIREGTAYGVRLDNGLEIPAGRVVANATVWNIYGKLVRPEHISPERLAWAQSLVPTYPSMTLYLVVDREALPAGVLPWEVFIENRKEIDSSDLTLYVNALVDKTLCPPDKLVITAIAPNLCSWPGPADPAYRSAEYRALKVQEANRMVDQIEQHYPGFRDHIQRMIVGTPTTIERYLLKNGGAVGGPRNMIGQEMLRRLHARSEWQNLYFCGDSTVMATGAPATVVSGVGAACVVLRDLHKKDYDRRRFPKQYVHFVELPYRRPAFGGTEAISGENAHLAAAQCQGCEHPACVADCPAGVDVPGFLRRMEAQNYAGAARLLRQRNPFSEVCGYACPVDELCQRRCHRRTYAGDAVRIAELERTSHGVAVTTSTGRRIDAGYVVAADGMWSPTRKLAGDVLPKYRGDWHAFRQYFTGVTGPAATELWVSFEADILPGYFWSFPLGDGRANVGFGIMRHDGVAPGNKLSRVPDMARTWPALLERPHIRELLGPDATPESPHRAWPIPARIGGPALTGDRVLYVGDAAAVGDPLTGEGIGQALITGRLAAESILGTAHHPAGRGAEAAYELSLIHI